MRGYFPFDPVDDPDACGLHGELVATSLGELHVLRPADGRLPEVLLLHGLGLDWSSWTPLIRAADDLELDRSWLAVDLPGFGRSADLTGPVTLDEIAAALVDVLDREQVTSIDVVGHSMGGFAALHLAARHPGRVRSVASVSGSYVSVLDVVNSPVGSLTRVPRTWLTYRSLAVVAGGGPITQTLVRAAASTGLLRLGLGGFVAHPLRAPRSLLRALAQGNRSGTFRHAQGTGIGYDWASRWSDIACRTLAIFGAEDRLVPPRDAAALGAALPGVQTRVLPDAAHLSPLEQPVALMAILRAWWEEDNTSPSE